MAKNPAIDLTPFDDLFETDESREDSRRERLMEIPVDKIRNFPNHPYKVKDDEAMAELVDSIKNYGLLQPVLVRPVENGMYEMVSGHRRKRAFELAGIETIPARVKELSLDEAVLVMVDSNLQREEILPSEKGFAYKMRLDAMKRQGMRTDLTSSPLETKLRTTDKIAADVGESRAQIDRYIRLTELIPPLLDMVDEKKIALRPAVEISYLPKEEQQALYDAIDSEFCTPSHAQTIRMRKLSESGELTSDAIEDIMCEEKPNQAEKFIIRDQRVFGLIPDNVPMEHKQDYVLDALQVYGNIPKSVPKEHRQEFLLKAVAFYQQHIERQKKNRDAR